MRRARNRKCPTTFSRQHPRIDLIFNEISGQGNPQTDLHRITNALSKTFATIKVWKTTAHRGGYDVAEEALTSGATLLIACGGDGTIAAVAAAIKNNAAATSWMLSPAAEGNNDSYDSSHSNHSNHSGNSSHDAVALGIIPRGTANALSAALHIPCDVMKAVQMISSGAIRRLDFPTVEQIVSPEETAGATATLATEEATTGATTSPMTTGASTAVTTATGGNTVATVQERPDGMLLLCGIGLEAETVRRAHRQLKRAIGAAAYAVAGLETIWRRPHFTADITLFDVDDALTFANGSAESPQLRLRNLRLQGVTVANAAPPTSVLAQGIGEVRPDDGLLEVVCIKTNHPFGTIGTMLSMLHGALLRRRETPGNVFGLRARKVHIVCQPPQRIVIDGEDAGETPITIEMKAGVDSINVIAPKAGTVNRRKRRISRSLTRLWRNLRGFAMFSLAISLLNRSRRGSLLGYR